jgi:hypothetical protein
LLSKIRNLFRPATLPEPVQDEILGLIQFNPEEKIWEAWVSCLGNRWRLCMAGRAMPDPNLLAHAREVAENPEQFCEMIAFFLRSEASALSAFPSAQEEVLSLRLESLNLFFPSRPNDGMLYFEGGKDNRVWRCDYIGRKPDGLGFDS